MRLSTSAAYNAPVKPLLRIFLNCSILLSFFLFVASVACYLRSYWTCDWLTYCRTTSGPYGNPIHQSAMLRSSHGHIVIAIGPHSWAAINPLALGLPEGFQWTLRQPQGRWEQWNNHVIWKRFGFQIINSRKNWPKGPVAVRGLQFPYWFLNLLFATPPILWLINRHRRARRSKSNLCPTCGYDLRATPDRCPECGTASS
jgi:hypothetical protein